TVAAPAGCAARGFRALLEVLLGGVFTNGSSDRALRSPALPAASRIRRSRTGGRSLALADVAASWVYGFSRSLTVRCGPREDDPRGTGRPFRDGRDPSGNEHPGLHRPTACTVTSLLGPSSRSATRAGRRSLHRHPIRQTHAAERPLEAPTK